MHKTVDLLGVPVPAEGWAAPVPVDLAVERPYWDSCRERAMRMQRCDKCGNYRFYPGYVCDRCGSTALTWAPVSGRGVVYTYSVIHLPSAGIAPVPYVWALIELEEGVVMTSNVVGCPADEVCVGMPVEVTYVDVSPEWTIPYFRLRADGA